MMNIRHTVTVCDVCESYGAYVHIEMVYAIRRHYQANCTDRIKRNKKKKNI